MNSVLLSTHFRGTIITLSKCTFKRKKKHSGSAWLLFLRTLLVKIGETAKKAFKNKGLMVLDEKTLNAFTVLQGILPDVCSILWSTPNKEGLHSYRAVMNLYSHVEEDLLWWIVGGT